jgi:NitT/TauT family transport system substrate-binding protein
MAKSFVLPARTVIALLVALASFAPATGWAEVSALHLGAQFGLGYLPLYVARDAGLLDNELNKRGLKPLPVTLQNVAGAPQINDGLLSRTLDIGCGGITALMVAWDKTHDSGGRSMKGIAALSDVPYVLMTTDPKVHSLRDFSDHNRIGVPAVKVSVPAIMLQVAAEKLFGQFDRLDKLTVSLAQPDGAVSLLAGGKGAVDSYAFGPPFNEQLAGKPGIHQVWSSTEVFGTPTTALVAWTTTEFRQDNPKTYAAFVAALKDASALIKSDPGRAAEIYQKAEASKLSLDLIKSALKDPELRFRVAPENSAALAAFLVRHNQLHHQPKDWKDLFFPEIDDQQGS